MSDQGGSLVSNKIASHIQWNSNYTYTDFNTAIVASFGALKQSDEVDVHNILHGNPVKYCTWSHISIHFFSF